LKTKNLELKNVKLLADISTKGLIMLEHLTKQIEHLRKKLNTNILIEPFLYSHYDYERKAIVIDPIELQTLIMLENDLNQTIVDEEKFGIEVTLHEYAHKLQYEKWGKRKTEQYYVDFLNKFPIRNEEEYNKLYPEKVARRFAKKYVKKLRIKKLV